MYIAFKYTMVPFFATSFIYNKTVYGGRVNSNFHLLQQITHKSTQKGCKKSYSEQLTHQAIPYQLLLNANQMFCCLDIIPDAVSPNIKQYLHKNIINFIRAQRLSWLSHIERMQGTRMVKAIYSRKPISRRPIGRPKTRWVDDVRKYIQKLKVPNWKTLAKDRGRRRELVEKVKTL